MKKEVFGDLTNLQKAALENRPDFKKRLYNLKMPLLI